MQKRKVYDCFTFFNELDLLDIRLNILDPYVDFFVLVEATLTFSGKPKRLFFLENRERFKPFLNKIRHLVVDSFPESRADWVLETHQRNQIELGIKDATPDDIVLISDLDEIVNPKIIVEKTEAGIQSLKQKVYYGNLNTTIDVYDTRAKILFRRDMHGTLDNRNDLYSRYLPAINNQGTTPSKIRMFQAPLLEDAGWHFSYIGGYDNTIYKIESYSHTENDNPQYKTIENLSKIMGRMVRVPIDDAFPEYIRLNQDKLSRYIKMG